MIKIYFLVIHFVFGFVSFVFFLRLWLQLCRAPFNFAFVQSLYSALSPLLQPIEKRLPRLRSLNLACVVVLALITLLWGVALSLFAGKLGYVLAIYYQGQTAYYVLMMALFAFMIISFLSSVDYEIRSLLSLLVRPVLAPFAKLPQLGPFSLAPMAALLLMTIALVLFGEALAAVVPELRFYL